ncbi:Sister chromatid cohesion protein PDS5 B-B [Orchesella cincta]|uniref:Sister chromatid cohesion protein PDS5 B-B n=1 Tax=Orchesella cincta TaxID=48709 RepID=A0A1D2NBP9_ORCCI|nr:Sister chromatid cohesion protein PDS5 B-B [Orchesella cincta]
MHMATRTRSTRKRTVKAAVEETTPPVVANEEPDGDYDLFPTPSPPQSSVVAGSQSSKSSNTTSLSSPLEATRQDSTPLQSVFLGSMVYPPQCKEITDELTDSELIRRLKVLSSSFQAMSQEVVDREEYLPLCLHLASDEFINHSSRDVQLLIACCIADILRVYAPEAPYKEDDQIHAIFMFLIRQLEGLKDPKDPAFKRYFYLLENLAYVKAFNMCQDLEESQEIFQCLFHTLFSTVSNEHSESVKTFMLDLLCPIISESNEVSAQVLRVVLSSLVPTGKPHNKSTQKLAKELIIRCSDALEPHLQMYLNQAVVCDLDQTEEDPLARSKKVYELIYELNSICPNILLTVIPQLEHKLKCIDESERLECVSLLARMFSGNGSKVAQSYPPLWQAFIERFNDVSVKIRIKCVQYSMHFLLNHASLRKDIIEALRVRERDTEDSVRFEVVKSIVATFKQNPEIVSQSEDLLGYVKERCLDKKWKIRRESFQGLGLIYKKTLGIENLPDATKKACSWIKDRVLQGYYLTTIEDKILIEKLLNTCLVPYHLEGRDRMVKLFWLYATIDENSSKAFIEIQKNLLIMRTHVSELLKLIRDHKNIPDYSTKLNLRINSIAKFFTEPVKSSEFICKLSNDLTQDQDLMNTMESIMDLKTDCTTCADGVKSILKKLGPPVMTNLYYNTIKTLLERVASLLVDGEAVKEVITLFQEIVIGSSDFTDKFDVQPNVLMEKGSSLISVLAYVFPHHFDDGQVLKMLIEFLSNENLSSEHRCNILSALMCIGESASIDIHHPSLIKSLIHQLKEMTLNGTPRQAKLAVRCLFVHLKEEVRDQIFAQVVKALKVNLDPDNSMYRTAIIALGHIALLMPDHFQAEIRSIVTQKMVKELLLHPPRKPEDQTEIAGEWCKEDELPELTQCMLAAMKSIARWLLGQKTDLSSAAKTFKMLTAFCPFSNAENSWLRLTAGNCMLKICQQKGVGDQFTALQFCILSKLMNDEVIEVRTQFSNKLYKGLTRGAPQKCLPLDFMGFYALGGYETDKKLKILIKNHMIANVNQRRGYIKLLLLHAADKAADQLPLIMPDYMLVFAVPILTHSPHFTTYQDIQQLKAVKECLWFIMEPLIIKNDNFSYGFYGKILENMKQYKNAVDPDNEEANRRMYTICDIALDILHQRSPSIDKLVDYITLSEPRIPSMYFKRHVDPNFVNRFVNLPAELQEANRKRPVGVNELTRQSLLIEESEPGTTSKAKKRRKK